MTQPTLPDDILQVQIPLPFALNLVNAYLIRDGGGWTLVDTGLVWAQSEETWRALFHAGTLRPRAIQRIIVTHHHPDHFGMAGWLQRRIREDGGQTPPILMTAREWESARRIWVQSDGRDAEIAAQLMAGGVPPDLSAAVVAGIEDNRAMTRPHPDGVEIVEQGETLKIGARRLRVCVEAGHADAQMLLYGADDRLMLCADHVLMRITPVIGRFPDTEPHPLRRFLASLRRLRDLDVRLALPGHKALITNWRGRIDELLAHHDARLNAIAAAVASQDGATVYDAARAIFDFNRLTPHDLRFALVETLAHLDELIADGRLIAQQRADSAWIYAPGSP
jgi:glyoxylase-like metal-dependent hydrolase (beta-lactamase superfamily II)